MNPNWSSSFWLSEIVLIPLCVVLVRLGKIEKAYYPFCILLALAAIQELVSHIFIMHHHSNAASVNIYGLLECWVIIWQFYNWNSLRSFGSGLTWLYALLVGSLILWVCCNLIIYHLNDWTFPFYRILYPFLIVLLSVNEINRMITHDNGNLYKNSRFVICLGFITFFLYQILYEGAFLVSGTDKTEVVSNKIISLFSYVNALVNGLFLIAALLIPQKRGSAFERIFERIRDDS